MLYSRLWAQKWDTVAGTSTPGQPGTRTTGTRTAHTPQTRELVHTGLSPLRSAWAGASSWAAPRPDTASPG